MKIAGLDIGTTGCRIAVFEENGRCLDKAYREYLFGDEKNELEINAEIILKSVLLAMQEIGNRHPDISGMGVSSFGETFVLTDENGRPLHNAIMYTDPRGKEECRELVKKLGGKNIASITGLKPHEMYSLPKLMWIKRNWPDVYKKAKHVFLMEDYIVFALTGVAQIDYSLASRTMAFDIVSLKWSDEMFRAAEIEQNLMSKVVPSGTAAGKIKEKVAARTGLNKEMQLISGGHDQVAVAVGAGMLAADKAVDGTGSVECITQLCDELPHLNTMYGGNYAVVPYVIPGKYVCYAFSHTKGVLIQGGIDTLKEQEIEPTGLLALPHFSGAATPYMDNESKGAIVGLTALTTIQDIYRACMEGVAYEMLLNMEYLERIGVELKMLHATGEGADSEVWMQMKADILNIPIKVFVNVEAGTVGSAILTGITMGCFRSLEDAVSHMIKEKKVYYPDKKKNEKYMRIYSKYKNLYQAVRPLV